MTGSKAPTSATGRPFVKGDPRINKNGRKSKSAVAFGAAFALALSKGGSAARLSAVLWDKAYKGQSWAIEIILDRLMGKVTQPLGGAVDTSGTLTIKVVETK